MLRIAVDAMGGDKAPDELVRGAAAASLAITDAELILVGDNARISRVLAETRHDAERVRVQHATEVVAMYEKPAEALAAKPESSILVATRLVARGDADALVSAGNTGAGVLACARHFRLIPGIRRAALGAVYPTEMRRGEKDDPFSIILDVGATLDVTADDLVAFALMGAAYATRISKNPRPRVALLSNGTEAGKGPREIVAAHQMLLEHTGINFIGNVEGVDIPRGTADVVVCSGFVGNVVIKMLEGVSETVMGLARYAYKEKLLWRAALGMLSGGIGRLKEITDWQEYGGAPLLGFEQLFIKAHGRSGAQAIENAIKVAAKSVRSNLAADIAARMAEFERRRADDSDYARPNERCAATQVTPRHVFRWDLDKTYLRSEFETVRDLVKSAMEKPGDKRAVPGAPAILRALRAAGGPAHRICIVSGSPRQMRKVLVAKLELDGIEFDEFVLKDNIRNLLRGRWKAMREQVQYKLPALLESRIGTGGAAGETLFGDDAESDATIYSLYADLCSGRVPRGELERVLDAVDAYPDARAHALDLAARVPRGDSVQRILIHLDKRSPTAHFDRYGPRLVPIYNYFQAALVLFGDGQLSARDVLGVAREMLASGDYVLSSLANSMQDLLRRGRMAVAPAMRLANECLGMADVAARDFGDLPPKDVIATEFLSRVQAMGREGGIGRPPPVPARLDYPALLLEERAKKKAAKRARAR